VLCKVYTALCKLSSERKEEPVRTKMC
jgi:hypothetical protein